MRRSTNSLSSSRWPVHGRLLPGSKPFLPDAVGFLDRRRAARQLPVLEIAPVRQDGRIEGGLVARLRVRRAEEMAARGRRRGSHRARARPRTGPAAAETPPPSAAGRSRGWSSRRSSDQPALQPAGGVQHEVAAALDGAPQREHALIGGLRVDRVGRAGVGGAVGHAVAPRELAADQQAFMYSGVPKAGAPDFMSTFEVKPP
jgi:hypothetical protein